MSGPTLNAWRAFSHAIHVSGSSDATPKYQNSNCTSSGVLRNVTTYAAATVRGAVPRACRMTASSSPPAVAATADAAATPSVSRKPCQSQDKYLGANPNML